MIETSIQEQVMKLLQQFPSTRNSDEDLMKAFTAEHCRECIDLEKLGFSVKMIKNILRARRKVQEFNPDLKACEVVDDKRKDLQEQFNLTRGSTTL